MTKRLFLFDLDGVLIDSKNNMKKSWEMVQKKFDLKASFEDYFNYIGIPFCDILQKLNIKKNHKKISSVFRNESIKNFKLIKPFDDVVKTLNVLKNNKKKIGIVTSKDRIRTLKIINKLRVNFDSVKTPSNKFRGKPAPDSILISITENLVDPSETLYVGDMSVDYLTAKRAKIDYIHADYGYAKQKLNYKFNIKRFTEILNFQ